MGVWTSTLAAKLHFGSAILFTDTPLPVIGTVTCRFKRGSVRGDFELNTVVETAAGVNALAKERTSDTKKILNIIGTLDRRISGDATVLTFYPKINCWMYTKKKGSAGTPSRRWRDLHPVGDSGQK